METLTRQDDKDLIVISREIDSELFHQLNLQIKNHKQKHKNNNCVLILTTPGGDPNAGYRMARCLQNNYKNIRLVVASYCKSAGTLIALCANEIAFGDLGELGPLDIQVSKQDEFGELASGLDIIEAMEAISEHMKRSFAKYLIDIRFGTKISTKLAGDLAAQLTSSIAAPLYAQIDPQRVAEMQRSMSIALNYGQRLIEKSKSLKNGKESLEKLVRNYPTHSFVIDKEEADKLFNNIKETTPEENNFIEKFWPLINSSKPNAEGGPFVDSYNELILNEDKKNDKQNTTTQPEDQENTEGGTIVTESSDK